MDWFFENYRQIKIIESAIGLCISGLLLLVVALIPVRRRTQDAPDLGESAASDSESKPAPKRVI